MKCIMPIFQPVLSTNKRATSALMRSEGKILPNAELFVFSCLFVLFFRIVESLYKCSRKTCEFNGKKILNTNLFLTFVT